MPALKLRMGSVVSCQGDLVALGCQCLRVVELLVCPLDPFSANHRSLHACSLVTGVCIPLKDGLPVPLSRR